MHSETYAQIRKALKENGEVSLLISNGRVSKTIVIDSFSVMPEYGNPVDMPNLVEVGIAKETCSTMRFDASYIQEVN